MIVGIVGGDRVKASHRGRSGALHGFASTEAGPYSKVVRREPAAARGVNDLLRLITYSSYRR